MAARGRPAAGGRRRLAERRGRHRAPVEGSRFWALCLGALGIVYGDIGTSPLYAMRECFAPTHGVAPTTANVMGVLSLIIWSLVLVISLKYLLWVLRADNRGEGGTLALMALIPPKSIGPRRHWMLVSLGLFGVALLYGDGIITPAITVLSAVEGIEVATPILTGESVPIAIVILIGLFSFQRKGTAGIGAIFGPVMVLWFTTLAALGLSHISDHWGVLRAFNPWWGVEFFLVNRWHGFIVLGAVFLVVTGGEALYADMGHFGRRPIRMVWYGLVLPALVLNYLGQGALLIVQPAAADNPFYRMAPTWALFPLVGLATLAAVIASQAMISGAFSLTRQAVQLGYAPRVEIIHTSAHEIGQIYVPAVNWAMMFACIGLVIGFQRSTALAAAYGIAVTTTMVITAVLAYAVSRKRWGWGRPLALAVAVPFLIADLAFFGSNILKIPHGGWLPLVVAAGIYLLMTTWKRGRELVALREQEGGLPLEAFLADVERRGPIRVPGTAVFLTTHSEGTPRSLLHNYKHNKVIHQKVVLLTVVTEEVPHVPPAERVGIEDLAHGVYRVTAHYGFMQDPDVPSVLQRARKAGLPIDPQTASYFLGRDTLIASRRPGMPLWREKLFVLMKRNALGAYRFFRLPPNRIIELGAQVEL